MALQIYLNDQLPRYFPVFPPFCGSVVELVAVSTFSFGFLNGRNLKGCANLEGLMSGLPDDSAPIAQLVEAVGSNPACCGFESHSGYFSLPAPFIGSFADSLC